MLGNDYQVAGFSAKLKLFPSDFKVIEIDEVETPCYIDCDADSSTKKQSCLLSHDAKSSIGAISSKNGVSIDKSIPVSPSKKLLRKSNSEDDESFVLNDVNCKSKLSQLLSQEMISLLQDKAKNLDEKVSLGKFDDKNERTVIHKCIRFLYPHISTLSDKNEIQIEQCPKYEQFAKLLGVQNALTFIRFACIFSRDDNSRPFSITGDYTKDERRLIHRSIDNYFGRYLMSKTFSSGKVIEVKRKPLKRALADGDTRDQFCKFVLHKINIETLDAIQRLSKCFGSRLHNFAYAGTKDKRAETWQWMTVKGKRMHELKAVVDTLPSCLSISELSMTSSPLCLGQLGGNRFELILRDVVKLKSKSGSKDGDWDDSGQDNEVENLKKSVENSLEFFKSHGFVNYFGPQRFGKKCHGSVMKNMKSCDDINQSKCFEASAVGQAILKRDWKTAVHILLDPNNSNDNSDENSSSVNETKRYLFETGDIDGTIKKLHFSRVREISILRALRKFTSNLSDLETDQDDMCHSALEDNSKSNNSLADQAYVKALLSLPHNILTFYVHAYCSLVWNKVAEERMRRFGNKTVEGDLVMTKNTDEIKIVDALDVQEKSYVFNDVVLPLPGNRTNFPPALEKFYLETLSSDGVVGSKENLNSVFRINQLRINVPGTYRKIVEFPRNLYFRWSSNEVKEVKRHLQQSCLTPIDIDSTSQNSLNLNLTFDLRPSSYATTFLQQLSNHGLIESP